jgi:penicillin-binding protein 2B
MMRPHVIDKIVDPVTGKTVEDKKPEVVSTPISEETAAQVREYLGTVVTGEHGTAKKFAINGYEVAGKTGTAQIPGNGGYLTGPTNYVFSFLGMAPKNDPELIVYVAVQQPGTGNYGDGSSATSSIFTSVMKNSLQYRQIEPTKNKSTTKVTNPSIEELSVTEATEKLAEIGLEAVVIGNGSKVESQIPAKDETLLIGEKVMIKTEGELIAPDMNGWSLRDVMKVAKVANMKLNSVGNGFVVKQNFKPGSKMIDGEYLIVDLDRPGENNEENKESKESVDGDTENAAIEVDDNQEQSEEEMTD